MPPSTETPYKWVYNGISHLQRRPPYQPFRAPNGDVEVGFVSSGGCALVPGPPIGPRPGWPDFVDAFEEHCQSLRLAPVFCGVGAWGRNFFGGLGYRTLKLGDEAVVYLDDVTLKGSAWREVRVALHRAVHNHIELRWVTPTEREVMHDALAGVSRAWLAARGRPEIRFGMGDLASAHDPASLLAVAQDAAGNALAFATWVPVPTRDGWMLDLMRYRPGSMAGLMDFVIGQSLLDLRAQGYVQASLGGVPFSNLGAAEGGLIRRVLDAGFSRVRAPLRPRSLAHFKRKFNPTWEPLYLASARSHLVLLSLLAVIQAMVPEAPLPVLFLDALLG